MRTRALLTLLLSAFLASSASAHYNMLLPNKHSVKKGEVVTFTYQWGHPFEHQLFDAPKPTSLIALAPDRKEIDLTDKLVKVALPGEKGKKVVGYQVKFTPEQRGDYVLLLKAAPIYLAEEGIVVEDTVKVVLHVQAQKGWDALHRQRILNLRPLTRPYGLEPGMVFQARVSVPNPAVPYPRLLVEVERYNAVPPKELPPEEHITRTTKTGPSNVVTTTLTDPGWWALTVSQPSGLRKQGGKEVPAHERCTLWVFVDEKPRPR